LEIVPMYEIRICRGLLIISQGDITENSADAIVNAANNHLWMGAGVAGAIKRKGGPAIEQEAMAKGPIGVGEAVATSGGSLKARYVIHAAGMGQDLQTSGEIVAACTCASLRCAEELGIRSIAFPAIGTGVGGLPVAEAAQRMIGVAAEFLGAASGHLEKIEFVLFDDLNFQTFTNGVENVRP
jgi:O-acetyl-ADP-ribose deacetylase (regulator of RNase III)